MNKIKKKLLGMVGLLVVAVMTLFASTLPPMGAYAATTDLPVSIVVGGDNEPGDDDPGDDEPEPPSTPDVPNTGLIRIGGMVVAERDLIVSGVIVFALLGISYLYIRKRRLNKR